ncbi:type II toxin-antitoxin system VapC family toxin [Neolewinella antarctica]|uniref:Ribonuclease VapC n=1 Tax=Neolewinella antarctica TaxID=442734 RepID=A0ABX0XI40_9BACT|nr:type II toxin-antitoxin system VapC family toxin [Neolewinella antarctica]NJC28521.1 tRNA(fMet)-specific endonuclease VapC [Neolewinella antarctica]
MKYLIDTDICIFYFKGKFDLHEKIGSVGVDNCYVSEITLLELTYGAHNSTRFEQRITEVSKLEELFDVLPIRPIADIYGQERKRLKNDGNLIPNFDLLIGCTAKFHDMVMVTRNTKHFERIAGIKIENWID